MAGVQHPNRTTHTQKQETHRMKRPAAPCQSDDHKVLNFHDVLLRGSDVDLLRRPTEWLNDQVRCTHELVVGMRTTLHGAARSWASPAWQRTPLPVDRRDCRLAGPVQATVDTWHTPPTRPPLACSHAHTQTCPTRVCPAGAQPHGHALHASSSSCRSSLSTLSTSPDAGPAATHLRACCCSPGR